MNKPAFRITLRAGLRLATAGALVALSGCIGGSRPLLGLRPEPCPTTGKTPDMMTEPCELSGGEFVASKGKIEVRVQWADPQERLRVARAQGISYDPFVMDGAGFHLAYRVTVTNWGDQAAFIQPFSSYMVETRPPSRFSNTALDLTLLWTDFERYRLQKPTIEEDLKMLCYYQPFSLPPHSRIEKLLVFDDFPLGNPASIFLYLPNFVIAGDMPADFRFRFEPVYAER